MFAIRIHAAQPSRSAPVDDQLEQRVLSCPHRWWRGHSTSYCRARRRACTQRSLTASTAPATKPTGLRAGSRSNPPARAASPSSAEKLAELSRTRIRTRDRRALTRSDSARRSLHERPHSTTGEVAEAARGLTPAQIEHPRRRTVPARAEGRRHPRYASDALDLHWVDRRRVLRISGRLPLEQGLGLRRRDPPARREAD